MGQQLYIRTRKKHPAGCFFQQNDYLKKGGELIAKCISPSIMKKIL